MHLVLLLHLPGIKPPPSLRAENPNSPSDPTVTDPRNPPFLPILLLLLASLPLRAVPAPSRRLGFGSLSHPQTFGPHRLSYAEKSTWELPHRYARPSDSELFSSLVQRSISV
ncbi:hypothetical protein M440DRAFT_1400687 [Trichoderma longibrachiatum ATCC 18648]|uniref:Uncharacterized protein n=1 Tax=Trichoderma longibrachiatum ATCC 18648 TaxID=983965 RepID=A0A2T4C896_TRILO|nr:hypothetical protein M440DRAFT_1400687 [Trichoderma longibrachiatum ATCC 18648]